MTEKMKPALHTLIRVGKISYTNSLPFYHHLDRRELSCKEPESFSIDFYEGVPAQINQAMQEGRLDIAPVSSLEFLNHQKDYLLLPHLAIGSRDFSGSVLLVSREKIEGLNKAKIALTRQSLSSAVLLKILLRFKYKFSNEFVSLDGSPEELLRNREAALVIGDDALFYRSAEFVYKYDLSELWWNWTGKPFCFAVWAVRREFATHHREELSAFYFRLQKNLETNLADIEKLLREGMNLSFMDERFAKLFGYLFNLNYGMDPLVREGLELFFRMAERLGVSPHPHKLEFFDPTA